MPRLASSFQSSCFSRWSTQIGLMGRLGLTIDVPQGNLIVPDFLIDVALRPAGASLSPLV